MKISEKIERLIEFVEDQWASDLIDDASYHYIIAELVEIQTKIERVEDILEINHES